MKKNKEIPPLKWLQPRATWAKRIVLLLIFSLLISIASWTLFFSNPSLSFLWLILLIVLFPLLILLPGLILGHTRTYAWACFVINFYFIQGILDIFTPQKMIYGWLLTLLSISFFCCALMYVRWSSQLKIQNRTLIS